MASPTGGQWIFGVPASSTLAPVQLSINIGGGVPPAPGPTTGLYNIEVFTAITGTPPTPDAGFQAAITDLGGNDTAIPGVLSGSPIFLGGGDYIVTDSVVGGHTPGTVFLGTGNQTVVGASGDLLAGGSGNQVLDAIAGKEFVVGGTGDYSVFGGIGDTIVGNAGATSSTTAQIVGNVTTAGSSAIPGSMDIALPTAGNYTVSSGYHDNITDPGSANAEISGASGDNIDMTGNTGNLVLIGAAATGFIPADTIIAGSGADSVWGAAGDSLVGGGGGTNVTTDAPGSMTILIGSGGAEVIGGGGAPQIGGDTIAALNGGATVNISLGPSDSLNLTNNSGANTVTGASGATVTVGSGNTGIDGAAGGMSILLGTAGTDNVTGSTVPGSGDTITGTFTNPANLDYNPSGTVSGGDLIDLTGSAGNATINAFSFGGTDLTAVNDTIIASTGTDSVFGGPGDRIGISTVEGGGTDFWDHSTSVPGAAMAFGTNNPFLGTSSANVTVTNFAQGTDSLFYQNETSATNDAIVASATSTPGGGGSIVTLPDGTTMTLIGVTTADLAALNSHNTLFK